MPVPASMTSSATKSPGGSPSIGCVASTRWFLVTMRSGPPRGMASRALVARLTTTCSICPWSALTRHSSRSDVEADVDVVGHQLPEDRLQIAEHGVQIEDCRLDRLAAAEGEELAGDRAGAIDCLLHVGEVGLAGRVLRQIRAEQLGIAADDHQDVVEVVRQAAGEVTDRIDLLRVLQLSLELVALRDVAAVEHDPADRLVAAQIAPEHVEIAPLAGRISDSGDERPRFPPGGLED